MPAVEPLQVPIPQLARRGDDRRIVLHFAPPDFYSRSLAVSFTGAGGAKLTPHNRTLLGFGFRGSGFGVRVGPESFFSSPENRHPTPDTRSLPGSTTGITSRQCTPGGIGNTNRSSRMLPAPVFAGNQNGVVASPSTIRRCSARENLLHGQRTFQPR
jgi:hypothetical protein